MIVKALSLWQPWASLLVHGHKRVETRGWPTSFRGPLLIHAAKRLDDEQGEICHQEPFRSAIETLGMLTAVKPTAETAGPLAEFVEEQTVLKVVLGAIVGRVDVIDCFPTGNVAGDDLNAVAAPYVEQRSGQRVLFISNREHAFGDYTAGRFAFLCANPVAFDKPIPFRGAQGFFDVPDNLIPAES